MLANVKHLVGKLLRKPAAPADVFYRDHDYLTAYRMHTDLRVARDPRAAIGGRWHEIGLLQFRFLVANGLAPTSTLLDYGCGTLRGGRHFIGYLDAGNYTGVDLSPRALEFGQHLVAVEGLQRKRPSLVRNDTPEQPFASVVKHRFDFVLAQSVITHLHEDITRKLLADVAGVMTDTAIFFFTYNEVARYARRRRKSYVYPCGFFAEQASLFGLSITDRSRDYPHPDGQRMLALRLGRGA